MATSDDELRQAAARFAADNYSHAPGNGQNQDAYLLARAWKAEHEPDDDVKLNDSAAVDWLNSLTNGNGGKMSMLAVRLCDDGFHLMAPGRPSEGIAGLEDYVSPRVATRGDVRRLLVSLGVDLKETPR